MCYQKHAFYAQCMRRGTCVPGGSATCTELHSELGQCSAAYKDCHLSACCQRGEDRCFLKNDGYGKCMPSCNPNGEQRDWQCRKHELPSEKHKLSCSSLRGRTNLYTRLCATQYQGPGQCNGAYTSSNNVYRPCVWDPMKLLCEESSQSLACDCELYHRGCPRAATHASHPASGAGGASAGAAGNAADDDGLSVGEGLVVSTALLIIICGCGAMGWYAARTRPGRDLPSPALTAARLRRFWCCRKGGLPLPPMRTPLPSMRTTPSMIDPSPIDYAGGGDGEADGAVQLGAKMKKAPKGEKALGKPMALGSDPVDDPDL